MISDEKKNIYKYIYICINYESVYLYAASNFISG